MNDSNDSRKTHSPKVINLSERASPPSERVGELLDAVRTIAGRSLQQQLGNMFEHVDDALFDLAEKAENNAAQMHYFDGMREVRKRRPAMERSFSAIVSRNLAELAHTPQPSNVVDALTAPTGAIELTLVADSELEESLAITSMTNKNETRLLRDLFTVNQRLSVICGGRKVDDASNPVAPALLTRAFQQALREVNTDLRVKLIIYKLFDRYVLSTLESLYQQLNDELGRAGVLPQLRHAAPQIPHADSTAHDLSDVTATNQAQPHTGTAEAESSEASAELLQTLQTLFNARRRDSPVHARSATSGGAGGHISTGPLPSANELLGALSVLQSQIASESAAWPMVAAAGSNHNDEVTQLKAQLLTQIGALRGERPSHVAAMDEDTIDLVGMLFEFILDDPNLPPEMQVLLARLQIPYLKAALLDRRLFAHRQHPARRLLDLLAEQAKGWSEDSDRDRRLHEKVKQTVEQLLHDFDDDLGIFERLLNELQQFQDVNKRRSAVAEQRVAESTRGREKLEQARRLAAHQILSRIDGKQLPPLVHDLLARAWANHLVLTLLRQGEASPEFKSALRFVDDFIASAQPTKTPESRQALRKILPGIERALRQGLANVAFQEADVERLLGQLHAFYRRQLGETVEAVDDAAEAKENAAILAMPDNLQALADGSADNDEPEESVLTELPPDDPQWLQVQALQTGTWIELIGVDQTIARAKLSWISPMSGRYLFVNRRGLKVADYSPLQLAHLLADGQARILAANALFDRAMHAIVDRLSQPAPADPSSPTDTP
ncbi:MAG: DUF1631 domain-containing protein [Rhodanobacter sp.]